MTWLLSTFAIFAFIYIFGQPMLPEVIDPIIKIIPMLLLILVAFYRPATMKHYQALVLMSLVLCMLGDFTIGTNFLMGLVFFLCGHLCYIAAFTTARARNVPKVWQYILLIYGGMMLAVLGGTLFVQENFVMMGAVSAYIVVILGMSWTALMTKSLFAYVGAIVFIISDSTLAIDKFLSPLPFSHEIIMTTYYAAQFCFAWSVANYSENRSKVVK